MRFECTQHRRPNVCRELPQVFDGFGGEDDGEGHSGQIIARFPLRRQTTESPAEQALGSSVVGFHGRLAREADVARPPGACDHAIADDWNRRIGLSSAARGGSPSQRGRLGETPDPKAKNDAGYVGERHFDEDSATTDVSCSGWASNEFCPFLFGQLAFG
jgi:hypothetical protein